MAGISLYYANAELNWTLRGTVATVPPAWAVGLATAAPSWTSGYELGTGTGLSRQTLLMASATSGSATNSSAMTFGPANSTATISGIQIWDTMSATVGNMIYYGTLAAPRVLSSGDSLQIAIGSLTVTIA